MWLPLRQPGQTPRATAHTGRLHSAETPADKHQELTVLLLDTLELNRLHRIGRSDPQQECPATGLTAPWQAALPHRRYHGPPRALRSVALTHLRPSWCSAFTYRPAGASTEGTRTGPSSG
ncbi:hypothetical protein KM043_017906 [Ampulex compressa]|nr:hypothetical protein KM043_017906 [Ampulex compressa]